MVDENALKALSCGLFDDVLCSFRKDAKFSIMARCFDCEHYITFMREMDEADMEEDAKFLAESERVNRFARCFFVDCLCDGELGKVVCFAYKLVGGRVDLWTCRRFCVEKLPVDSVDRQAYLGLVGGVIP